MTGKEFLAKLQAEAKHGFNRDIRAWVDDDRGSPRAESSGRGERMRALINRWPYGPHELTFDATNNGTAYSCSCGWSQGWIGATGREGRRRAKEINRAAHQANNKEFIRPHWTERIYRAIGMRPR